MQIELPASIGVVSDTHGTLDPAVCELFEGVDLIVHAGDIGGTGILLELEAIAPTLAVRGNTDHGPWAETLPESVSFRAGDVIIWVVHDETALPAPAGVNVIVSGHTHRPASRRARGVLHLNPGSAAVPRGRAPHPTVATLQIDSDGSLSGRIHRL